MRKLQTTDIFAFCRLINAIGIKEDIKNIAMNAEKIRDIKKEEAGFDLLFSIFEKAIKVNSEDAFFQFCTGIFEMEVTEIKKMNPVEFIEKLMDAADLENWKAFFSRAASLMQRN